MVSTNLMIQYIELFIFFAIPNCDKYFALELELSTLDVKHYYFRTAIVFERFLPGWNSVRCLGNIIFSAFMPLVSVQKKNTYEISGVGKAKIKLLPLEPEKSTRNACKHFVRWKRCNCVAKQKR